MTKIKDQIIEQVKLAQSEKATRNTFYENQEVTDYKNEFLFFIKPEITLPNSNVKLDQIIDTILAKTESFKLTIKNASILTANYLDKHNIIAQHYGVINQLSKNVRKTISEQGKEKFKEIFNASFDQSEVFGSLEFLKEFSEFTPLTLDYLWQNVPFHKLAGGTYAAELNFNGRVVYLVDGFHPRQLDHFVQKGRSIVTMTLVGNTSWADAREKFIGATNPEKAEEGSLRRTFFENQDKLGLPAMSSSWNGVHLSAGPVEGLVELIRYNSDFEGGELLSAAHYPFGVKLMETLGEELMGKVLSNADIQSNNETISVFDATEEKDSDEALEILKNAKF